MSEPVESDLVVLKVLHDPLRAEILCEALGREGIVVASPGLHHRSLLGMVGSYIEIVLRVPGGDFERAKQIVDALEGHPDDGALADDAAGSAGSRGEADDDDAASVADKRSRMVAAFLALGLSFGAGHIYARRFGRAAVLLASELVAVTLATTSYPLLFLLVPVIMLVDLFGAWSLIPSERPGRAAIATGIAVLLVPLAVGSVPLAHRHFPTLLLLPPVRRACAVEANCGGDLAECHRSMADRVVMLQVDYRELARCLRCISDRGCEAAYKYCWDPCRQIDLDH